MPDFSQLFGGGGVKAVQRGVASVSSGLNQDFVIPITPVNPLFTELRHLGSTVLNGSASLYMSYGRVRLSGDGQSVIVNAPAAVGTGWTSPVVLSWELTEHYTS